MLKERDHIFSTEFTHVHYCSPTNVETSEKDKHYAEELSKIYPHIEFHLGIPNYKEILEEEGKKLIILDDLSESVLNDPKSYQLFAVGSAHHSCSVVLLAQTLFLKSKYGVAVSRNCSHKVVFLDKGHLLDLSQLSKNAFPQQGNIFYKMLCWIEEHCPHIFTPYILINNSHLSRIPSNMRFSTNILRDPQTKKYLPIYFEVEEKK